MKKHHYLKTPIVFIITACFMLMSLINLQAQTSSVVISGTVTDSFGDPLIGVNVLEKGTTNGTITNVDGQYTLTVASRNAILTFSYIGFSTKEVNIEGNTVVNVQLGEDTQNLDEVIVVGYGTMKKSDLTGSVKRVDLSEKTNLPNMNLAQALSGASAGINLQQVGMAGGESELSIRGKTSLSANNNPLVVLDGIIYNGKITDININDVEYIDVLKDASAAAVYGSRSANGVIIITTKKGKSDKPKINFNMYAGTQWMTNNPMKVMNADQYAIRMIDYYYQQELYDWYTTKPTNNNGRPVYPDINNVDVVANRLRTAEEGQNYRDMKAGNYKPIDWMDVILRDNPVIQSYDASFSGSSGRMNYYASASYSSEEGIIKNDQYERYTFNTKVDGKLNDWISLGMNVNYAYQDYSGLAASVEYARQASPLADNDLDSPDNYRMHLTGESYMRHPLGLTKADNEDIRNSLFFVANAKIEIPFVKGLSYDFNYSNTYYNRKNNIYYPSTIDEGAANKGRAEKQPEEQRSWIYNNIITYINSFGDHSINATLLYSREKYRGERMRIIAQGFDEESLGYNNLTLGTILTTDRNESWEEMGVAYMARVNYQYKHRYMITGTVRRDGFSGFGANSKFVTLPSVSLGWVFSEEPFMEKYDWLYGKLRLSYGQNGNQGIGRYSSLAQMTSNYYVYDSSTAIALYPSRMGNNSLAWEKTDSYNLGLDYGFLHNRISGSIDLYTSKTSNVLVERRLPYSSGYENVWTNIGEIKNKGIEIELNTLNIETKDWSWRTGFVFSLNRDKITKLYGGANDIDIANGWFVGEPIFSIYDYKMAGGVWTEEELFSGKTYNGWYPGQFRYEDLNDDGIIDPENDRTIVGNQSPNYRFSISSTLNYKNWSFYFLINSIQGGNGYYMMDNYNVVNVAQRSDDVYRINQSAVRQYWTPDNGVDNATGIYNNPAQHSNILEDRSFVRLQDVSLSYNFTPKVLKALGGLDYLQLFISGKNLYTWTKWSGWDPELINLDSDLTGDSRHHINTRNVVFGLKLSF